MSAPRKPQSAQRLAYSRKHELVDKEQRVAYKAENEES